MSGDFKRCNLQSYLLQLRLAVNAKVDNEACTINRKWPAPPGAAAAIVAAAAAAAMKI
jgi:hypothetical protein